MKTCTVDGCDRPVKSRGWCGMHYKRVQRGGDPGGAEPKEHWYRYGGRPPKPWTAHALQMLEDGGWRDFNRLVTTCAAMIPPNVAKAYNELSPATAVARRRARAAEGRSRPSRQRVFTPAQELRAARRDMMWRSLHGLWRGGRIEIDPPPVRGSGNAHYTKITNRRVRLAVQETTVATGDAGPAGGRPVAPDGQGDPAGRQQGDAASGGGELPPAVRGTARQAPEGAPTPAAERQG